MIPCGRHLQRLEVSRNQLCDLSHISGMENLIYLNVSGAICADFFGAEVQKPTRSRYISCAFKVGIEK
jgi:hypothetical protein